MSLLQILSWNSSSRRSKCVALLVKLLRLTTTFWYHVGIINAEVFDSYNGNWLKFLDDLIHGDGGGDLSQYVGEEILSTDCTPGTQYVAYGFAYASGTYQSDLVDRPG